MLDPASWASSYDPTHLAKIKAGLYLAGASCTIIALRLVMEDVMDRLGVPPIGGRQPEQNITQLVDAIFLEFPAPAVIAVAVIMTATRVDNATSRQLLPASPQILIFLSLLPLSLPWKSPHI
eukprot:g55378.t1